jgi:acyl-CoA synthetase (AMP-forming)/AMP-acid ligase II
MTITGLLDQGRDAQRAIVVPEGPTLSYAGLRDLTSETIHRLSALGMKPGDRVAIVLPKGPDTIAMFLAVAQVATACPMNSAYTEAEFRFYLDDTGATFLIVPPGGAGEARRAFGERGPVIEAALDHQGRMVLETGSLPQGVLPASAPDQDDIALVLHTSGTTSRPKRVPLRHRNLVASVDNIVRHYGLGPDDISLSVMPLFHVHGLVCALATFASGGTVVVPPVFSPMGFWPVAREARPTWFTASPTPHQFILMRTTADRPPGTERLRFVRSCSAALSPTQMARMEARFGVPVLEAYGMTEASHQMASNPLPPGKRVPGSVGLGTGVEIAILDDAGRPREPGRTGEVAIRGSNVIDGYEDNPEANAASFTAGWFRTGDLGTIGGDGYLTLLGRIKELINRAGEKISPREIDEVLESHPAVQEAVCFGIPHETWGEEVAAAVVLREPQKTEELVRYCRARLAEFKVPRRIYIVESSPRTPTGKVQRRFVAEQFVAQ